jgi:glutamyl-tRNA reductase
LEPTLVVVGLNHRTAAVEIRERFWMSGCRQAEVLSILSDGEGIEELLVYSTCNRTEFLAWGDATLAVNSILRFLTAEYDLKLREWNSFYRLLDEQALTHAFRVACGLDSMCIGEKEIARQVTAAWKQARNTGCTGPQLDAILPKALSVRRRIRSETPLGSNFTFAPLAALRLADQIFGSLADKSVVVVGAGRIAEVTVRELVAKGAQSVRVVNRTPGRAQEMVRRIAGQTSSIQVFPLDQLVKQVAGADLVIGAAAASRPLLGAEEMKQLGPERNGRKLVLIDLALPRDVDPVVREFDGVLLYDLEDLERAVEPRVVMRAGEADAERVIHAEVQSFRKKLIGRRTPEMTLLRARIDEICRQELESFRMEQGPLPIDQDRLIAAVTARIANKMAGSLARELKASPNSRAHKPASAGL